MNIDTQSLCRRCIYRLRRIFIPTHPENYISLEDEPLSPNEDNVIISNHCLILDADITDEITLECSYFNDNKAELYDENPFLKI